MSAQSLSGNCTLMNACIRDGGNRKSFSYFISLLKGSKLKDITACRHDYLPGSNTRAFLFGVHGVVWRFRFQGCVRVARFQSS